MESTAQKHPNVAKTEPVNKDQDQDDQQSEKVKNPSAGSASASSLFPGAAETPASEPSGLLKINEAVGNDAPSEEKPKPEAPNTAENKPVNKDQDDQQSKEVDAAAKTPAPEPSGPSRIDEDDGDGGPSSEEKPKPELPSTARAMTSASPTSAALKNPAPEPSGLLTIDEVDGNGGPSPKGTPELDVPSTASVSALYSPVSAEQPAPTPPYLSDINQKLTVIIDKIDNVSAQCHQESRNMYKLHEEERERMRKRMKDSEAKVEELRDEWQDDLDDWEMIQGAVKRLGKWVDRRPPNLETESLLDDIKDRVRECEINAGIFRKQNQDRRLKRYTRSEVKQQLRDTADVNRKAPDSNQ